MGDFKVGDEVWFECDGEIISGVVSELHVASPGNYFVYDNDKHLWSVAGGFLFAAKTGMEMAAEEYDEIMRYAEI